MKKGMRAKVIRWDDCQGTWRTDKDREVLADAELPLNFYAKVYRAGVVCTNLYWSIVNGRGEVLRAGEASTEYLAKCACQSAWEDELRSAFEESEGCSFCLHMHVVKETTDYEETALQIIDGNQLAVSSVAFDNMHSSHGSFKTNYCPLCNRKLSEPVEKADKLREG